MTPGPLRPMCAGGVKGALSQSGNGGGISLVSSYQCAGGPFPFAAGPPGQVPCSGMSALPAVFAAMPCCVMQGPGVPMQSGNGPIIIGQGLGPGSAVVPVHPGGVPPSGQNASRTLNGDDHAPPATPESRDAVKNKVKAQIEYYLSDENLFSDVFLRSRMNEEGWVPVGLLAGFRRVQSMTHDTSLVLEAISSSPKLEMDADGSNVRLKDTWQDWLLARSEVDDAAQAGVTTNHKTAPDWSGAENVPPSEVMASGS